jgi:hypothetical protein
MAGLAERVFVGRSRELELLSELVDPVAAGHGALRFLTGEPGIGKTRLAARVARVAEEHGFRVVWGRCWEAGGAPAYWPWSQVFRGLGLADPFAAPEARAMDLRELRFQQFERAARLLGEAAAITPLALVLDDLHAADLPSLGFLQVLARGIAQTRILLVGTHRDAEARLTPEIGALLAKAAREGDVIALDRLAHEDVVAWMREAAPDAPERDAAEIHAVTEGNPLFVHEVLRVHKKLDVRRLPHGLSAVIEEHLARVPADVCASLATASVLGREIEANDVAALTGTDVDTISVHLSGASDAGLLEPAEGGVDRYAFTHVLVRDRLYAGLSSSRRAALHWSAGERFATADLARAAHHLLEGRVAGGALRAAEVTRDAAALAMKRFAFEDAARLTARATDALGEEHKGGAALLACELAIMQGEALARAGDAERGAESCIRAAVLAGRLGSAALLARAALAYGIQLRSNQIDDTMIRLLREALAALEAHPDDALRARVMARLGAALTPPTPESYGEGVALAREAWSLARQLADKETLLYVGHYTGTIHYYHLPCEERGAILREVVAETQVQGDRLAFLHVGPWWFAHLRENGMRVMADAALEDFARFARDSSLHRWRLPLLLASRALLDGDFDEAARHGADLLEAGERANVPNARVAWVALRIAIARARGAPGEISSDAEEILRHPSSALLKASWDPWVLAAIGRESEARERLNHFTVDPCNSPVAVYAADAAVMLRDPALAASLYDLMRPFRGGALFGENPVMWGLPTPGPVFGPTALVAADLAALLGRAEDAHRLYDEAIDVAERVGGIPFVRLARERRDALAAPRRRSAAPAAPTAATAVATLARTGDYWNLAHEGRTHALKARRGFEYLAALLAEPDHERHVLELSASDAGQAVGRRPEHADAVLDASAKAAYRARIDALRDAADDAEAMGDGARAARARAEIDAIAQELARALGIGGRDRTAATAADRARAAVTLALRRAIEAIREVEPVLGGHLAAAVRTGFFCSYRPDPSARLSWRVTT